jgi:hypothetical protein
MKKISILFLVAIFVFACKTDKKTVKSSNDSTEEIGYQSFGNEIIPDDALSAERMAVHYEGMSAGDTVNSKMIAKVEEVCQSKGCWMKLNLENGEQVMVKFKDYGFFMPKDIAGKEVIVNGLAFVDEMSVDDQQHYAEDAGQSAEEVSAITKPKKTYSFEADGVLLKN